MMGFEFEVVQVFIAYVTEVTQLIIRELLGSRYAEIGEYRSMFTG